MNKLKRKQWSKSANAARERKRLESEPPDYPVILPDLRRKIVITDYDFGEQTVDVEMYKTPRIDCYKVFINGELWKRRVGWSNILAEIRKRFLRLRA